eukprot:11176867-Lingulodinium_polyedra.AAC.1
MHAHIAAVVWAARASTRASVVQAMVLPEGAALSLALFTTVVAVLARVDYRSIPGMLSLAKQQRVRAGHP